MANLVFDEMTGELTTEDIQEGIRCDHEACPLARALENMFPGYYAFVDDYVAIHNKEGKTVIDMAISDEVLIWLDRFDNEKPVEPIQLRINTHNVRDCPWILGIVREDQHTIGTAEWTLGIVGKDQWIK